jgi:hypothetical protein
MVNKQQKIKACSTILVGPDTCLEMKVKPKTGREKEPKVLYDL